jgi:hypothetical protein
MLDTDNIPLTGIAKICKLSTYAIKKLAGRMPPQKMRDANRKKRPDKFSKYPLEVQEFVSGFIANLKTVTSLQDI